MGLNSNVQICQLIDLKCPSYGFVHAFARPRRCVLKAPVATVDLGPCTVERSFLLEGQHWTTGKLGVLVSLHVLWWRALLHIGGFRSAVAINLWIAG